MGPIGSGKSVTCCMEIAGRAFRQAPGPDGIRRTRWAVIRNTYPELKSTTIKTWTDWFKPEWFGTVKWDSPITQHLKLAHDVELEVLFLALDRPDDIKKLLSLEVTGVWINEAREIPKAVLDAATGRVGRFPSMRDGGATWWGVIMDTNPPDDDHWWYKLAEEEQPDGFEFFRQPSGRSSEAENVANLPNGYYENMTPGKTPEWIKVYVDGDYGTVIDGRPVYPEFNERIHVAPDELVAYRGLPLILSWDFGLTPACIISQVSKRGQWRILDELVSEDMGIRQFSTAVVKPFLANVYPGLSIESVADPAGNQRAQTDEKTCYDELSAADLKTRPAWTNEFTARREAVAGFLTRLVDGEPAFLLSPSCKTLRKGFNGGYRYRRLQVSGEDRYTDSPEKNGYSHPHDALQYAGLHIAGPVMAKKKAPSITVQPYAPIDPSTGY